MRFCAAEENRNFRERSCGSNMRLNVRPMYREELHEWIANYRDMLRSVSFANSVNSPLNAKFPAASWLA